MTTTQHTHTKGPHLLPQINTRPYAEPVAEGSDIRKIRVDPDLWAAYAEIVGNWGRSADLKSYIEWRVDNPTTPLPGRRRGPVRRERKSNE